MDDLLRRKSGRTRNGNIAETVDNFHARNYIRRPFFRALRPSETRMNPHRKTFSAKPKQALAERGWWVIDAEGKPLGRLASKIAIKLRGKDKPTFTPHVDTGDFVVVVNAAKIVLTGNKADQKKYYRHSGYSGGLRVISHAQLADKHPEAPITKAVWGMLPKNRLGRQLLQKLKVYTGPDHPHVAQNPQPLK